MTRIVEVDEMLSAMELTKAHLFDLLEESYEDGVMDKGLENAIEAIDKELKLLKEYLEKEN